VKLDQIATILQVGLSGLAFLLALLSYNVIANEQRKDKPRPEMLKAARLYFFLCIAFAVLVGGFQLADKMLGGKAADQSEVAACRKSIEDLRASSQMAQKLEHLRAAVQEQERACSVLVGRRGEAN
jgi:hypothetical protein